MAVFPEHIPLKELQRNCLGKGYSKIIHVSKNERIPEDYQIKKTLEMTKMISSPFSKSQFEGSIRFF